MLTERFSRLFSKLLARWTRYQDAPRDPSRVTELAADRIALDEVRGEIALERARLAEPVGAPAVASRVAVSDSDLSRLRVAGIGFDSNA